MVCRDVEKQSERRGGPCWSPTRAGAAARGDWDLIESPIEISAAGMRSDGTWGIRFSVLCLACYSPESPELLGPKGPRTRAVGNGIGKSTRGGGAAPGLSSLPAKSTIAMPCQFSMAE